MEARCRAGQKLVLMRLPSGGAGCLVSAGSLGSLSGFLGVGSATLMPGARVQSLVCVGTLPGRLQEAGADTVGSLVRDTGGCREEGQ